MNQLLKAGTHPQWLTQGCMVLIMKLSPEGYNSIKLPANNLPLQKSLLLSGIIGSKMSRHATQYMTRVQKWVHSGHRGTKLQLVIDRAVSRDCKIRKTNLCTAQIDYKSYEMEIMKRP